MKKGSVYFLIFIIIEIVVTPPMLLSLEWWMVVLKVYQSLVGVTPSETKTTIVDTGDHQSW